MLFAAELGLEKNNLNESFNDSLTESGQLSGTEINFKAGSKYLGIKWSS